MDLNYYVDLFNKEHSEDDSRGKAFDYIHNAFINALKSNNPDCDYLALQLYAYLGSWGMIHHKSILMQRNYKILTGVIKLLIKKAKETRFAYLINFVPEEKYKETYKRDILTLKKEIVSNLLNDYGELKNVTDTLVGKILLGTFGCMPAYDTNFCKTARDIFNMHTITIENSIDKVLEFAIENKVELESLQNGYPIMKVLDMAFWEKGQN